MIPEPSSGQQFFVPWNRAPDTGWHARTNFFHDSLLKTPEPPPGRPKKRKSFFTISRSASSQSACKLRHAASSIRNVRKIGQKQFQENISLPATKPRKLLQGTALNTKKPSLPVRTRRCSRAHSVHRQDLRLILREKLKAAENSTSNRFAVPRQNICRAA